MKKKSPILRAIGFSPAITTKKILTMPFRRKRDNEQRQTDLSSVTYSECPSWFDDLPYNYFDLPDLSDSNEDRDHILFLAEKYLNHEFNMLGSGWVKVYSGMNCKGIEDFRYHNAEPMQDRKLWFRQRVTGENYPVSLGIAHLISGEYLPIDWQIDFKSGFSWKATEWYKDIKYGNVAGADIKVPWELGRMQHLSTLAIAASIVKNDNLTINFDYNSYLNEFRNQVLGFIASNPPRFGVQWKCTMDVAIRVINWLFTYDLLRKVGATFDEEFLKIFRSSLWDHFIHIRENLEWSSGMRGNHYFAGIAGLLFLGAYLPVNPEITSCLAFSIQEIINEIDYQFLDDGSNFEASTNYHFLSFEILNYCYSMLVSLPREKLISLQNYDSIKWQGCKRLLPAKSKMFEIDLHQNRIVLPGSFFKKYEKIASFAADVLKPNGEPHQIGDNDSGRIIILPYDKIIYSENNDRRCILEAYNSFCKQDDPIVKSKYPETSLIDKIMFKNDNLKKYQTLNKPVSILDEVKSKEQILCRSYVDFGLYIYTNDSYVSTVRCGSIGQRGKGGHTHNDQLSITLCIDGVDLVIDPGTFCYTPLPALRNKFRSTMMHNTLYFEGLEQNDWNNATKDDLFWLNGDRTKAKAILVENDRFTGIHYGYGSQHKREIKFEKNEIVAKDHCDLHGVKRLAFHFPPGAKIEAIIPSEKAIIYNADKKIEISSQATFQANDYEYSPQYGIKRPSKVLTLLTTETEIEWKIKLY